MNRRTRLSRITPLRSTAPLQSRTPLEARSGQDKNAATRRTGLRPVSAKRAAENRERRAMIAALYPERPRCARPGCTSLADDIHEPLTRARGGSIVDPGNCVPLCRPHHDELTFRPESELAWAYDCGLLRHSWDGPPEGRAA